MSYLTPPSLDGTPPTEAAIPPEMQELESEFTDMLAHLPRERTYASIAFHGPLPDFVRSIPDDLQADHPRPSILIDDGVDFAVAAAHRPSASSK
ncbi:MAG: hypothetical protein WA624_11875 [Methylocella sp.]